jgi:glycosyltransferase involved in cell wall biosynthesis
MTAQDGTNMSPHVTFLVPCYKLGNYLKECVDSILAQSYTDFEVLILDDCSPDNTPEVARSFQDPRVQHVRNETNLGHLRNYNKGIGLAKGQYIWLISADDRLRRPYVLQQYVELMDRHPAVGYVFCPAVCLEGGTEKEVFEWTMGMKKSAIVNGRRFLSRLLVSNTVATPSILVRKECYEKVSLFPLDLPYAGDWYLWCLFALHYDVAYIADPMVNYRLHEQSVTNALTGRHRMTDNLSVRWRIKRAVEALGLRNLARQCRESLVNHYSYCLAEKRFQAATYGATFEEFEKMLEDNVKSAAEKKKFLSRVYAGFADGCYRYGQSAEALRFYLRALGHDIWMPTVWAKILLLQMGSAGAFFRTSLRVSVGNK